MKPVFDKLRGGPLLAMFLAIAGIAQAQEEQKPNILFIFCDDLAYQAISTYGDSCKLLETPNIDRIAREGMLFQQCVVPNSICAPSRAVILTGKYSHVNGIIDNRQVFMRWPGVPKPGSK